MAWYLWLIVAVAALVLLLIAVLVGRAIAFRPGKEAPVSAESVHCDEN